jgi:hypothetical protein
MQHACMQCVTTACSAQPQTACRAADALHLLCICYEANKALHLSPALPWGLDTTTFGRKTEANKPITLCTAAAASCSSGLLSSCRAQHSTARHGMTDTHRGGSVLSVSANAVLSVLAATPCCGVSAHQPSFPVQSRQPTHSLATRPVLAMPETQLSTHQSAFL